MPLAPKAIPDPEPEAEGLRRTSPGRPDAEGVDCVTKLGAFRGADFPEYRQNPDLQAGSQEELDRVDSIIVLRPVSKLQRAAAFNLELGVAGGEYSDARGSICQGSD